MSLKLKQKKKHGNPIVSLLIDEFSIIIKNNGAKE